MKLYGWAKNALKLQRAIAEANVAKKGNFTEEDVKEVYTKMGGLIDETYGSTASVDIEFTEEEAEVTKKKKSKKDA